MEGHAEIEAVPILLRRMVAQWRPEVDLDLRRPHRLPRGRILHRPDEFRRALELCRGDSDGTLVLFDADRDRACELGPQVLAAARAWNATAPVGVVVAEREFESWFVAAAPSLAGHGLPHQVTPPTQDAVHRDPKGWLGEHLHGYDEILHQPKLTAKFDLTLAATVSPSFDKCRREVLRLVDVATG